MEVKGGVEAEASGGVVFAKAEVKGNGRQRIVYMVVRVRFRSKTRKDRTFWQKDPSFYANILCKILMMCELLSHCFSHSFIQLILGYTVGILASFTSIPNTKTDCFRESC